MVAEPGIAEFVHIWLFYGLLRETAQRIPGE
jgi:hypothetical protein